MARKVTLQTIAEHLGVSRTTVSNAYNRPDQLAPELRERVLATAAQLGYAGPDAAARRLRTGGREAVGLLSPGSIEYAFIDPAEVLFMAGFAHAVEAAGLGILMLPGSSPEAVHPPDAVRDAVVVGFCAHALPHGSTDLDAAVERGLPLVLVDGARTGAHTFIGIDDLDGARQASQHLVDLGHRRVGAVTFRTHNDIYRGPVDDARAESAVFPVAALRLRGWREPLLAAGVPAEDRPVEERSDNTVEAGADAVRALLARAPRLTAIVFPSDRMAFGGLQALRELGREDVSVVGFDDVDAARIAGLTTVAQRLREKGETAGRLLVEGATLPAREIILPVELRVRDSTRPPVD